MIVYTGNGKGKTSAAIGAVVRTLGVGGRVAYVQFMKGALKSAERDLFTQSFSGRVLLITADIGFFRDESQRKIQAENAQSIWSEVLDLLGKRPPLDLLVLDELNYVLSYGLLDEGQVLKDLGRRGDTHVVITGRNATEGMIEAADTVSEILEIKHAFTRGRGAVSGIDF